MVIQIINTSGKTLEDILKTYKYKQESKTQDGRSPDKDTQRNRVKTVLDSYSVCQQRVVASRGTRHQGVHRRPDGRTALFEQRRLQLGLG